MFVLLTYRISEEIAQNAWVQRALEAVKLLRFSKKYFKALGLILLHSHIIKRNLREAHNVRVLQAVGKWSWWKKSQLVVDIELGKGLENCSVIGRILFKIQRALFDITYRKGVVERPQRARDGISSDLAVGRHVTLLKSLFPSWI